MTEYISPESLQVFDNAEDASDQNQHASSVESNNMLLQWQLLGFLGRQPAHTCVEEGADDDKRAKEGELDKETTNNDILSRLD